MELCGKVLTVAAMACGSIALVEVFGEQHSYEPPMITTDAYIPEEVEVPTPQFSGFLPKN